MDLNTYRNGALKVDELEPKVENVHIIDDSAVVTLTMKLKGSFNGGAFDVKYRYIRFWKQCDDVLKVVGGSGIAI